MTARCKLMHAFETSSRMKPGQNCSSCVYFSGNLDTNEYPALWEPKDRCGLGFLPGDTGCSEMRTDNCSSGKPR